MSTILIVEDSQFVRKEVRQYLESKAYGVIEASNGLEGIGLLVVHPQTDLMIVDINMPKLDGLSMVEKLNHCEFFKKRPIPIIMLTTEFSPKTKENIKRLGIKGWLTKPFAPQRLQVGLDSLIKRK